MATHGNILIVSAPSGGGKGTILGQIMAEDDRIVHSVSVTTRLPRENEIHGMHYCFATPAAFKQWIAEDKFLEWAEVHGNYYGTLNEEIEKHIASGHDVVLELDVQGMRSLKAAHPEVKSIFIKPPSMEVLEARLRTRGDLKEEDLQTRLRNAYDEIEASTEYDYVIVNDSLPQAVSECKNILTTLRQS